MKRANGVPGGRRPARAGRDTVEAQLDTHAVARSLTAADFTPAQADALTDALRRVAEHGDHVTSDQFKVGLAEVRTEIANLDTRLSTQVAEVRTEIANLDTRLSTQIAEVRSDSSSGSSQPWLRRPA